MGRENGIFGKIKEKFHSQKSEGPLSNEIIILKPQDETKKYGYDAPHRKELKSRLDFILQENPQSLVKKSIDLYGERMVASLASNGSTQDLKNWLQDPIMHTLKGKTKESLVRIGISIDFADQMKQRGNNDEETRETWQERQPVLNFLSLNSALARVGYQHFGSIHEVSVKVANKNGDIKNEKDEAIRKLFEKDYTLPEGERGH